VHENPFYKVREDKVIRPNGNEGKYYVTETIPGVFVIPVDADGNLLCIKLFRYPTQQDSWEFPAGGIEKGETPLQTSNARTNGHGDVFICSSLHKTDHNEQAEEGITQLTPFSMKTLADMIAKGEFTDAVSLAPLMMAVAAKKLTMQF
jgi:hypothetical protein